MQVAAILSDLKSLAACPPEAALHLVTVHKSSTSTTAAAPTAPDTATTTTGPSNPSSPPADKAEEDPDLARASTLIALHQSVKVKYEERGLDEELLQLREDVRRILGGLGPRMGG